MMSKHKPRIRAGCDPRLLLLLLLALLLALLPAAAANRGELNPILGRAPLERVNLAVKGVCSCAPWVRARYDGCDQASGSPLASLSRGTAAAAATCWAQRCCRRCCCLLRLLLLLLLSPLSLPPNEFAVRRVAVSDTPDRE